MRRDVPRNCLSLLLILVVLTGFARSLSAEPLKVARQPAEFEPLDAVWLIWPPVDHLAGYSNEQVVVDLLQAIVPHTKVVISVASDELAEHARATVPEELMQKGQIEIVEIPSVEFWTRDMGPVFVETLDGEKAIVDFNFDAWGYGDPSEPDTQTEEKFDERVAEKLGIPCISSEMISEGGDREVNGLGTLMVVESVELDRNPGMTREEIEAEFARLLGVKKVIWLKRGLREDDHTFLGPIGEHQGQPIYTAVTTNGHIDEFARFVGPSTVLLAEVPQEDLEDPIARENHERLEENYEILKAATDQDGNPLKIIRMPLPRPVFETMKPGDSVYDYISTLDYEDGSKFPQGKPVTVVAAGSSLNFLITDQVVVGQKFFREGGDPVVQQRDTKVQAILEEVFPERQVVLIDALAVNFGGGGVHCITMQEPRIENANDHQGFRSLIPTLVVLVVALLSHRTFESLLVGSLAGFVMLQPTSFFEGFVQTLLTVMQDEVIAWVVLVCGLFGSLVHLLVSSGGAIAFATSMLRWVNSGRSALIVTWIMGLLLFIDDYLNALTIGSSMKPVTDRFRISREMLAYVVDSTAAPVCVLVPLSTWAIYFAGLLEEQGLAASGQGLQLYMQTIPYAIYGWIAVLCVPLVAWGVIPPLGAMKAAQERAKEGPLAPPGSDAIALDFPQNDHEKKPRLAYFVLPMAVLIGATIYFDVDALKGIITAVTFTVVLYVVSRVMTFPAAIESVFAGFKTMLYALAIIVMSFVLKEVNDGLGLTEFVIESVSPWLNRMLLPAIVFISLAAVTFSTGSFWGVYAISLPIVIPLAAQLEVNQYLAMGAVISSGAFGSHACFYGDASVLSASAAGCNNMAHVLTQLPYALVAAVISTLVYLILGIAL